MARTKEFDPDAVLEAAMELFWQRGYEATSIADLVEHLGIGRASLYSTFGDKRQLYLQALDRYLRTRDPDPIELLSQPGPVLPAVEALIRSYAASSAQDELRRGCFMVNTAVEMLPQDDLAARRVEAGWTSLEATITAALVRARAQGELSGDADPRELARFLLVVMQGLRVVGKAAPTPEWLLDAAEQSLRCLR